MSDQSHYIVTAISCSLSAVSSATFLICFLKKNALREKVLMKLLAVFQSFDLITSLNLLNPENLYPYKEEVCKLKGFINQLMSTSEAIWIFWFSMYVYKKICLDVDQNEAINVINSLFITFSISLPISLTYLFLGLYEQGDYFCQAKIDNKLVNFFLTKFVCNYLPLFIVCGWGIFVTWKVYRVSKKNCKDIDWEIFRFQVYPFIVLIAYIFLFVDRVMQATSQHVPENYEIFSIFMINSIGFINFITVGFTKEFRNALRFKVGVEVLN